MPKPTTKADLLDLSQANYDKLLHFINELSPAEQKQVFPPGTLNRNIRDVLAHLHHWHLLMLEWYAVGMTGKKPSMPAAGFTWKTLPDLNKGIHEQYAKTTLNDAVSLLASSMQDVRKLIERHSQDELFEKKRYHWTGSTSLGAYLIMNTASHYDWAYKLIKKSRRKITKAT